MCINSSSALLLGREGGSKFSLSFKERGLGGEFLLFFWFLLIFLFSKQAIFAQESPQLQRLTQLAVSNNAELKASVARYQMAKLRFTQVRANPDPMLMIQYQNEGLSLYSFGQTAGSQWMIGLTQEFPLGKLDIKGQMQEAEIELYRINALMVKTKLIAQIKEVNADFYGINQQMKLLLSSKDVLKTMGAIALKQYAEGRETQDNVLMIQLDQYLLEEKYQMQKTKLLKLKVNSCNYARCKMRIN